MIVPPTTIEQVGPGIDLSNQPEGISVQMSDPVRDLEYALNTVTLTFDLSGFGNVRLLFKALEYGDEPHAPPPGPFGDAVNFDGVAVSGDGVNWYEIQELRSLRSDRLTVFNIDLSGALVALGLEHGSAVRIRFCQYDDNPAPMDGFSIQGIELIGELRPPILYLTMNDNAATPTIMDASAGHHDQTLVDPGNPNTNAHSVPGRVGTALNLLIASYIDCGVVADGVLAANHDFSIAFWWKSAGLGGPSYDFLVGNRTVDTTRGVYWYTYNGNLYCWIRRDGSFSHRQTWAGGDDAAWHHYVTQRRGTRFEIWRDGVLGLSDDGAANSASVVGTNLYIGRTSTGGPSAGTIDDLRIYDRALLESEIQGLAAG